MHGTFCAKSTRSFHQSLDIQQIACRVSGIKVMDRMLRFVLYTFMILWLHVYFVYRKGMMLQVVFIIHLYLIRGLSTLFLLE